MSFAWSPEGAARELLRRRHARASLVSYVNAIDIPGKPVGDDPDAWLSEDRETRLIHAERSWSRLYPGEDPERLAQDLPAGATHLAPHHLLICQKIEATVLSGGRLMMFLPPGSAKSTYGSVVAPTWCMGRFPGFKIILGSYASNIARKQGRRARSIVRSRAYRPIFGCSLSTETSAADEWGLTNGSEFMAGGLLAGMTGNRANGILVDDPVAGRDEADSETIRKKTREAYEDDLRTRLIPGGFEIIIQTRWHEDDLAGGILPANWKGESGPILCRDGQVWEVICLPAIAERADDPLGRKIGERLWADWFTAEHFAKFQRQPRTWSALFQQRPTAETGDYFQRSWIKVRSAAETPRRQDLRVYGASDYAVTSGGGDFTVHVVVGVDAKGDLWLLDLWREQTASDKWVESWCDLVLQWRPLEWAEESGQIKAGVGPFLLRRAIERNAFTVRRQFPTKGDKSVRAQSIRGRMAMRGLNVPADAPWLQALIHELLAFPAGKNDDQVDALGLFGQLLDHVEAADGKRDEARPAPRGIEAASLNEIAALSPRVDDYL